MYFGPMQSPSASTHCIYFFRNTRRIKNNPELPSWNIYIWLTSSYPSSSLVVHCPRTSTTRWEVLFQQPLTLPPTQQKELQIALHLINHSSSSSCLFSICRSLITIIRGKLPRPSRNCEYHFYNTHPVHSRATKSLLYIRYTILQM